MARELLLDRGVKTARSGLKAALGGSWVLTLAFKPVSGGKEDAKIAKETKGGYPPRKSCLKNPPDPSDDMVCTALV